MKKLFLLLAFTGVIGAASATSVVTLAKGTVITLKGDDKKGDDKKKEKKSEKDKACCKKDGAKAEASTGSCHEAKTEGKACCKKGGTAEASTTAPAEKK
ncbi:MAG: hypothetical protein K0Q95_69 [Bacteroidota bacterium]|jgi:hypothetical protein|nr:hypothetical protein [Bacteroidota bacterium]